MAKWEPTLEINYGGSFVQLANDLKYINGKSYYFEKVDVDLIGYFDLRAELKDLGWVDDVPLYWLKPGCNLQNGLVKVKADVELMKMVESHEGLTRMVMYLDNFTTFDEEKKITTMKNSLEFGTSGNHDIISLIGSSDCDKECDSEGGEDGDREDDYNNGGEDCYMSNDDEGDNSGSNFTYVSNENDLFDVGVQTSGESTIQSLSVKEFEAYANVKASRPSTNMQFQVSTSNDQCFMEGFEHLDDEGGDSDCIATPNTSEDEDKEFVSLKKKSNIPVWDSTNPQLKVGMKFGSAPDFRKALREFAIKDGRDITFKKNESLRISVVCKQQCGWRVYASRCTSDMSFQIKTMGEKHTCGRTYNNRQLTSTLISMKYADHIRSEPNKSVVALKDDVLRDLKVDVSRSQAYRAKKRIIDNIYGDDLKQYAKIWDYAETLKLHNRGSNVKIKVETLPRTLHPIFQRLYICLNAQKVGFLNGCRPFISLDGCFLKGQFKGQMLTATGRDANNALFPLAFAVVEAESKDSWTWFLDHLLDNIGPINRHGWTFISDRQKGLEECFQTLYPGADHRICVKHLYGNFRDRGFKGQAFKDKLWGAASAYTKADFKENMEGLKNINVEAFNYLSGVNPCLWARHTFSSRSKCDLIVNNLAESFNAYILEARDKPILTMVEKIRSMLMERFAKKRDWLTKVNSAIMPNIQKKLEKQKASAFNCKALYAGNGIYQVMSGIKTYNVDLEGKSCGCNQWDISGIPCKHAIAAMQQHKVIPENYVHDWYKRESYAKSYEPLIYPLPSEEQWVVTNLPAVAPPKLRKQPGRPKKNRKRGVDEQCKYGGVRLRHKSLRCSNCMQYGHNYRTCSTPVNPNRKIRRNTKKHGNMQGTQGASTSNQQPHSIPQVKSGCIFIPRYVESNTGFGIVYEQQP